MDVMNENKKTYQWIWLTGLLCVILTCYSAYRLFGVGTLSWHIMQPETLELWIEMGILFSLLVFSLSRKNSKVRLFLYTAVIAVFCWIHVVFFPMFCAAVYLLFLYYLGCWFREYVLRDKKETLVCADGLLGAVLVILLFCTLSLFGIGGMKRQIAVLIPIGILLAVWVLGRWNGKRDEIRERIKCWSLSGWDVWILAGVTTLLLLQAGRMNLAVDYDSLWYGLRSEYILDNGHGIYENLGTLGVVYTYSKAQEILLLPFCGMPSHSFVLAFSIYFTALALFVFYKAAKVWIPVRSARCAVCFLACVPAVMNMAVSAKTDAGTLLVQIMMFYFLLRYWKEEEGRNLLWAFCCLLFSFTLKPTSIVFSSAVFGMSILYDWYSKKRPSKICRCEWMMLPVFSIEVLAVFARTWKMTGVPVTSIYTSIFQKLGFAIRYPFEIAASEKDRYVAMAFSEKWNRFLQRLYGVLLCPEEKVDMAHVIFAWGGLFCLAFLVIGLLWIFLCDKKTISHSKIVWRKGTKGGYLFWIMLPMILGSLYILFDLSQIDGNYYNFVYALVIFCGCYGISQMGSKKMQIEVTKILLPVCIMGVVMTSVTNWAWQIGLNEIELVNKGYFDHEEKEEEKLCNTMFGNRNIWTMLGQNPRQRVIAVGEHPDMLLFPCSVQSYGDIAGSWGNPMVVADEEKFREFVRYAKTDYVYIQAHYMCRWEDPYPFLCKLIYQGILTDLIYENGNVLARVNADGVHNEKADRELERFGMDYYPADWPVRLQPS